MRIPTPVRRLHREIVPTGSAESFVARAFRLPRFPFRWHYHPEVELTLIVAGRGLRFVGDSIEHFREGDLCLLGSDCPHTWYSDPTTTTPVESLVIQFRPELFGAALDLPELRRVTGLLERARRGLRIRGRSRARVVPLVAEACSAPVGSARRVLALLGALAALAEGRDCVALASGARTIDAAAQRRIGAVFSYLHEPTEGVTSQREAARRIGLAPAAFSRFFHRTMGKTFVAYLNELRIGTACRALIESDRSITAIAHDAGFNNLSNFNRRFRVTKGTTPRAYRRLSRVAEP